MWPFKKKPPVEPPRWGGLIRIDRIETVKGEVRFQPMYFLGSYLGWKELSFKVFAVTRQLIPDDFATQAEAEAAADKYWGGVVRYRDTVA